MPHLRILLAALVWSFALWISCAVSARDDRNGLCQTPGEASIDPWELRIRPDDEIWIISSRCIELCEAVDLNQLKCFRWSGAEWTPDNQQTLVAEHQASIDKRTVLFLHGNRTNLEWSAIRGIQVFDSVFGAELNRQPIRFVIWSWPADPQSRRLKEYHDNSRRSVWEANVLAEFLRHLGGSSTVGLVGYSFGAQAVVAGAEKACYEATDQGCTQHNFRIVCIAPAYQKPWSRVADPLAGCDNCLSEPSLQMSNSQDRALRVHYFISRFSKDIYSDSTTVDERSPAIRHPAYVDIAGLIGPKHSVVLYVSQPFAAQQIREVILDLKDPSPETVNNEAGE